MGGNRSMGMRAMLVTPMTSSVRQMTMMKYGLRMENPGICLSDQLLILFLILDHRDRLGVNLLPDFQAAAVADHNLLPFVQTSEYLCIGARFETDLHRALLQRPGTVNRQHRRLVSLMRDRLYRHRRDVDLAIELQDRVRVQAGQKHAL